MGAFWRYLAALLSLVYVAGQEGPNPLYETNMFNTSQNFRQDFCEVYKSVARGDILLANALQDIDLRALVIQGQFFRFDDGTINEDYPGLEGVLMDEICHRAGCTWRGSYATVGEPIDEGKTWTDLLLWSTETYDISVDWWISSIDRLQGGATFPEPFLDASIIMVTRMTEEPSGFNAWAWLAPFDRDVWIMIVVTVFVSSLVYWTLEQIDSKTDRREETLGAFETTWLFATAFTGQFEFDPQSNPARLFTFSVSFWSLIIGASYTANLASFLVVRNQPTTQINTLEEAVKLNVPMCIHGYTGTDETVSAAFPTANLLRREQPEMFQSVLNGECTIAITTVSEWESFQYDETVNGECNLHWIGRAFHYEPAGFATLADSGTLCTSLVRDVFNVYMREMRADGTIKNAWDEHFLKTGTVFCDHNETTSHDEGDDSGQLTLENMGGVFMLHGVLTSLALFFAVAVWFRTRQREKATGSFVTFPEMDQEAKEETIDFVKSAPGLNGNVGRDFTIESLHAEMNKNNENLRAEMNKNNESMRAELNKNVSDLRAEMKQNFDQLQTLLKDCYQSQRVDL
jgi:hypothetical protein